MDEEPEVKPPWYAAVIANAVAILIAIVIASIIIGFDWTCEKAHDGFVHSESK